MGFFNPKRKNSLIQDKFQMTEPELPIIELVSYSPVIQKSEPLRLPGIGIKYLEKFIFSSEIESINIFCKGDNRNCSIDYSILLLENNGKIGKYEDFIFYNQHSNSNRSVFLFGEYDIDEEWDNIFHINFSKMDKRIEEIILVCSIYEENKTFKNANLLECKAEANGKTVFCCKVNYPEFFEDCNALILLSLKRSESSWLLSHYGTAFKGGLASILNSYTQ